MLDVIDTFRIIEKIKKGKRIIIFGAGKQTEKLLTLYNIGNFESYVDYIIDNDKSKHGSTFSKGNILCEIHSIKKLLEIDINNYIILVTPQRYKEIEQQLYSLLGNNIEVYRVDYIMYQEEQFYSLKSKLEDVIVFVRSIGTNDNVIALAEYIRDQKYFHKYKFIWLTDAPDNYTDNENEVYIFRDVDKNIDIKKRLEYRRYMYTAKYIICENVIPHKYRSEQKLIYLNHGAPSIKNSKGLIDLSNTKVDIAVVSSRYTANQFSKLCNISMENLVLCGSPRTDVFYHNTDKVDGLISINRNDECSVLWAPTFRQIKRGEYCRNDSNVTFSIGLPIIETKDELLNLNDWLRDMKIHLLLKPHPNQCLDYWDIDKLTNISVITNEQLAEKNLNINILMKYTDALITDYSTISFDYMLLNRPIAYTVDDVEDYKIGFTQEADYLRPGEWINNLDGLEKFFVNVKSGNDVKKNKRNEVLNLINDFCDGNNSKRLCDLLGIS